MSRRSRARAIVLQVLYQYDLNPDQPDLVRTRFVNARLSQDEELVKFATRLLDGVRKHRESLDEILAETAENWRVSRMAATDRNVLRLGAYEILHTDTPDRVVINEAIDLAKRYGTDHSAKFVNGVLDKLMKRKQADAKSDGQKSNDAVEKADDTGVDGDQD